MEIFIHSIHAAEIKFYIHVLWTLSFEFVKKNYLSSQVWKTIFLYTCMQNLRLPTVYRQRKWPLLAPVRKIMALGWNVFYSGVECLAHGLRSFNGAVQRRLATLTFTMLISSCWQMLSEVELRPGRWHSAYSPIWKIRRVWKLDELICQQR